MELKKFFVVNRENNIFKEILYMYSILIKLNNLFYSGNMYIIWIKMHCKSSGLPSEMTLIPQRSLKLISVQEGRKKMCKFFTQLFCYVK